MKEIFKNLFIGTELDCSFTISPDWSIVHACKNPCHVNAVSYKGSLPSTHPNYLVMVKEEHLFLNIVDMENELSPFYTNPIMKSAIAFIEKHIATKKILIHCNQGLSRSPSIALLYLAIKGFIANDSYTDAVGDFRKMYPVFNPGRGISLYMNNNWGVIMTL
jgi:predicted protein tyrosine phosphatase